MVASTVVSVLRREKRSKRWLAQATGIAYSTLRRKLQAQSDLTVNDLARIARALEVSPASLLPAPRPTGEVAGEVAEEVSGE